MYLENNQADSKVDRMEQPSAIASILHGIDEIPKYGRNKEDSLVVFDSSAWPILTSGNDEACVVFAAAQLGKGRVFACAHHLYVDHLTTKPVLASLEKLGANIRSWLLENECDKALTYSDDIPSVEYFESVMDIPSSVRLLKWTGQHHKTDLFISQLLRKYVINNGGALLCGASPSDWLSASHSKTSLDDMSLNKFLSMCGICFYSPTHHQSSFALNSSPNWILIGDNAAKRAHFVDSVRRLENDMASIVQLERHLVTALLALPCDTAGKHLQRLQYIVTTYIRDAGYAPRLSDGGVSSPIGRALLRIASRLYEKLSSCSLRVEAAPFIDTFPGSFVQQTTANGDLIPATTSATLTIQSKFDEFHSTGYYMAPGSVVKCNVIEGNPNGWQLRVGCHTDDLAAMSALRRWPSICASLKLRKSCTMSSAFGGLIYLASPKGSSFIKLRLDNVLKAPYFDLSKPSTMTNWDNDAKSPGLWAEISGRHISFAVPSSCVRELSERALQQSLTKWDMLCVSNHELRGSDPLNTWRERVVVDIQPLGDSVHSGYPIVISYDYIQSGSVHNIFDAESMLTGCWNVTHELAHTMQRNMTSVVSRWSPDSLSACSMANLFTLHGFDLVFGESAWTNRHLKNKLDADRSKLLDSKIEQDNDDDQQQQQREWSYDVDVARNSYLSMTMFVQLVHAFGWNLFKILFRECHTNERISHCGGGSVDNNNNNNNKWDQLIKRVSSIVGLDVSPLFFFWGVQFSVDLSKRTLNELTPWLPDDEITRSYPGRVARVKRNYKALLYGNESLYTSCPKE